MIPMTGGGVDRVVRAAGQRAAGDERRRPQMGTVGPRRVQAGCTKKKRSLQDFQRRLLGEAGLEVSVAK